MAGAFSAMFTPFTPNNTVNEEAIFQLIEYGIGLNYNMIPRHFAMICEAAAKNDFRAAAKWQDEANRLVDLILEPGKWDNWSNFKILMRHVGIDCGFCRAPYGPLSPAQVRERLAAFARLGIVEKNRACAPTAKRTRA
jgi:dihydrodipicolinate synthase/N-acetylneuraminate lyase